MLVITETLKLKFGVRDIKDALRLLADSAVGKCRGQRGAIDPFALIHAAGIKVIFDANLAGDGRIVPLPDSSAEIRLNSNRSKSRVRFTAAHEFAHWLLIQSGVCGSQRSKNIAEEESIANKLAAELLMPDREARRRIESIQDVRAASRELSTYFKVSEDAATLRLFDLLKLSAIRIVVIPSRLRDANTAAVVDVAATRHEGYWGQFKPGRLKIMGTPRYCDIVSRPFQNLAFEYGTKVFRLGAQVTTHRAPIDHAVLLGWIPSCIAVSHPN